MARAEAVSHEICSDRGRRFVARRALSSAAKNSERTNSPSRFVAGLPHFSTVCFPCCARHAEARITGQFHHRTFRHPALRPNTVSARARLRIELRHGPPYVVWRNLLLRFAHVNLPHSAGAASRELVPAGTKAGFSGKRGNASRTRDASACARRLHGTH